MSFCVKKHKKPLQPIFGMLLLLRVQRYCFFLIYEKFLLLLVASQPRSKRLLLITSFRFT